MRLPTLFVSHGAPTLALEDDADARFLAALPARLPRPRALLVVSAHWQAAPLRVGTAEVPVTMHDFGGFPAALSALQYPAPGSRELAALVCAALARAGHDCEADPARGLDHGVWVPLRHMWPRAELPVVTLSLPAQASATRLLAVGAALSSLPEQGVLLLGSGGYVHNLAALQRDGSAVPDWARAFAGWMDDALLAGRLDDVSHWRQRAPYAAQAHPSDEHLAPLFVALGAAGQGAAVRKLYDGWRYGTLSMAAFAFGAVPPQDG